jgi:hypothetical protein
MEIEAAVLETDEDAEKALGDAVALREAPLAVGGRAGPEELALRAEEHGRNGVREADIGNCQPKQKGKGDAKAEEEEPGSFKKLLLPKTKKPVMRRRWMSP